jgi:hypothetical protein
MQLWVKAKRVLMSGNAEFVLNETDLKVSLPQSRCFFLGNAAVRNSVNRILPVTQLLTVCAESLDVYLVIYSGTAGGDP